MLNSIKLAISGGIVWGGCMFISTILSIYTGYATEFLNVMSGVYPGFSISWPGAFIGLIYGFIDVFVGLFILAWLYNKLNV